MATVLRDIQTGYNKHLTAEGQRLAKEASRGFAPLNEYLESAERKQIQEDAFSAVCKNVWLAIDYPEPANGWDVSAAKLYLALADVISQKPSTRTDMERLWQDLAGKEPVLAALPSQPAVDFLARKLFPLDHEPTHQPPMESSLGNEPAFAFAFDKRMSGDEPFMFWLFSRQGMRLKIQSCVALALFSLTLGLAGFDALRRSEQNQAFVRLVAASNRADFPRVVEASEDFLAHPALRPDDRTAQVKRLYAEALVRWFSLIPGKPDETAVRRAHRYQQLAEIGREVNR
jgi:hypothetical protein